jgi:hypothetical protein
LDTTLHTQVDEGGTLGEMTGFLAELRVEGLGAHRIDPGLARARIELDGNGLTGSTDGYVDSVDGTAELVIQDGIRLSLANIPDQRRAGGALEGETDKAGRTLGLDGQWQGRQRKNEGKHY